ncbi:MAG: hypothetical protein ACRDVP_11605 [Acidimicrobiales bacterium]
MEASWAVIGGLVLELARVVILTPLTAVLGVSGDERDAFVGLEQHLGWAIPR